ncbi:uncharacterized protein LOC135082625 [Ostrinia nubilalis]|uniref:uncharacterized protein LOC135082625 n=1 Tax=Ostrinia nubilalis TaxID=29057 RepID=UPI0030822CF8
MEFCPQLSAFQGVIISADNVYPFSRLTSRGGNEEKIKFVIDSVSKFLTDGGYIISDGINTESIVKLRKFAFFLILNSDLTVLSDMTDMEEIELVIWTIPTIPKCLMCEMFWRLHFDTFVYEAIAFCDPDLASEIAAAFLDNIKYYTPNACLNKIGVISAALYKLICRIYFFNFYSTNLTNKLTMVFNNLQKAINFFTDPPKSEWLNSISTDDQYKYRGDCLYTMLILVSECMEEFMSMQDLTEVSDPIYMLTYIGNVTRNVAFRTCDCPTQEILDCVNKSHLAILDKCQELVMDVSLDIFCAWSEFDENGKTMQRKIGEFANKLRTKLLEINGVAEHPVIDMMVNITVKPKDIDDIVNNTDPKTIIEHINSSDDKGAWIRALIKKDTVYEDEELAKCVMSHLNNVFDENECYEIYKEVNRLRIKTNKDKELYEQLLIKLFHHCNLAHKEEILDSHFAENCFRNLYDNGEFSYVMTETFNKLIIAPDSDFTDVLCLFLQNPRKVYEKIFNLAADNEQQKNIMLKVMTLLEKYSNHYYDLETEPCIIQVAQNAFDNLDTDAKQHNFIKFMCALKNSNCITGTKLLMLIIMPHMHKALLNRDVESLNIQCRLLKDAFTLEELMPYRAPMLAMLGQILDVVRWKINTFVSLAPETVTLALELQCSLINTYGSRIPDNELSWLKTRLKYLKHELNVYYYRKLWDPPGNNIIEILSGYTINNDVDLEDLVTWMSQAICSSTQQEWGLLWDSLSALGDTVSLDIVHNAVALITLAERPNRMENSWPCVLHMYRNFVYTIRYKYFKEPLTNSQIESVLERIILISNVVDEDSMDELSSVLIPLFAYLAERKGDFTFDITDYLTDKCSSPKLTDILMRVFSNGTA